MRFPEEASSQSRGQDAIRIGMKEVRGRSRRDDVDDGKQLARFQRIRIRNGLLDNKLWMLTSFLSNRPSVVCLLPLSFKNSYFLLFPRSNLVLFLTPRVRGNEEASIRQTFFFQHRKALARFPLLLPAFYREGRPFGCQRSTQ